MQLLTGGLTAFEEENPAPEWLQQRGWLEIGRMSTLAKLPDFYKNFSADLSTWKKIYDSASPESEEFPAYFSESGAGAFHRILVLRALRPDKCIPAVRQFVGDSLGEKFTNPPPFDLEGSFADSVAPNIPLIFVLSPGSDPGGPLFRFAEKMNQTVASISLGQGQGVRAEAAIESNIKTGGWVLLQNCVRQEFPTRFVLRAKWSFDSRYLTRHFTASRFNLDAIA